MAADTTLPFPVMPPTTTNRAVKTCVMIVVVVVELNILVFFFSDNRLRLRLLVYFRNSSIDQKRNKVGYQDGGLILLDGSSFVAELSCSGLVDTLVRW